MREEFLHMENKKCWLYLTPCLTHYSWIKKYKTKFKKLKTEEKKKLARFQFYRNVFKTMKNHFFCKSIEDGMPKEVFPSKIRTQI